MKLFKVLLSLIIVGTQATNVTSAGNTYMEGDLLKIYGSKLIPDKYKKLSKKEVD